MKRKIKGLWMALCMVLAVAALTGCSSETELKDSVTTLSDEQVESYKTSAAQTVQTVAAFDDEQIEQFLSQQVDEFSSSAVESWKGSKGELGAFKEITAQSVEEDGSQIIITSLAEFEKAQATVELILDVSTGMEQAKSMSFNVNYSMTETMKMAGLNTLMGIGIVFCMLLFLSLLIAQFKHIAKLEAKFTGTKEERKAAPIPVPAAAEEPEELVDDGELVAVIAAAIAASENTSTDSFTVRSIRKSNVRRWKRA